MNVRDQIITLCQRLHGAGYLAAADGNVSCKHDGNKILITPSGRPKAFVHSQDIAEMTLENKILSGNPSSERLMHLAVYRSCPSATWVIHAHPITAIAWSIAKPEMKSLPSDAISEVILAVGSIPIVPYARPGTEQMGEVLSPFLPKHRVLILARHGAISWGESMEEAYNGIERLEHSARILKTALEIGGITSLPSEEIAYLKQMREQAGDKTL